MYQKRYKEAMFAYDEAKDLFENLGEPGTVATAWHQIGIVHEENNDFDSAEKAYKESLKIRVQQKDRAGEAPTLLQLGNLSTKAGRLENALLFYRQAADTCVETGDIFNEGRVRNNSAQTLIKLNRFDEARDEIRRAIACYKNYGHAAHPWMAYHILPNLEMVSGNRDQGLQARKQAIELFLEYRRAGGENHDFHGKLCALFVEMLKAGKGDEMGEVLVQHENNPEMPSEYKPLIPALRAILSGSRDPALVSDPAVNYQVAVEVILVLERL